MRYLKPGMNVGLIGIGLGQQRRANICRIKCVVAEELKLCARVLRLASNDCVAVE